MSGLSTVSPELPPRVAAMAVIVREAGARIMEIYRSGRFQVTLKDDRSPLTAADRAADAYLREALPARFGLPVVSEECEVPYEIRREWEEFWLVDPLDGSKDFMARNGQFAVNIALIRAGRPVCGVVFSPAQGDLYGAEEGLGAFVMRDGVCRRLPCVSVPGPIMMVSVHHHVPLADEFARLNGVSHHQTLGSSLKFGRVAEGSAHLYPRFAPTKEWDTAAGQILVAEAGGCMVDLVTRAAPAYNKPVMANHHFLAAGSGVRLDSLQLPA
jgi:3'(2'), 5'-bisphosphate nucleotidase